MVKFFHNRAFAFLNEWYVKAMSNRSFISLRNVRCPMKSRCRDTNLRRNLIEVEILEWVALSHLLSNNQQQSDDISTKSLLETINRVCTQSLMGPFKTI